MEFCRILFNLNFHYYFYKICTHISVPSLMNPVHIRMSYLFTILFSIFYLLASKFSYLYFGLN